MELKQRTAEELYGKSADIGEISERYSRLARAFETRFGRPAEDFFSASGRTEICGNHTDHNHGKVLVAAIGVDTLAAAAKNGTDKVTVASDGYPDMTVDLKNLEIREREKGTSVALVKGVAKGLIDRGYGVCGADVALTSTVFRGAGVSSSASFELAVCEIFNVYANGGTIPPIVKAQIAQFAENVYFGKPCGLLDQAGIALGSLSRIDFRDPENPELGVVAADFTGYRIVITNTGGDHSKLTPSYSAIRTDMETVAKFFGKSVLRDVDETEFYARIPELFKKTGGKAILRAVHFFEENKRVDKAAEALACGDIQSFFDAVNESGSSSYTLLQNCYVEGTVSQEIPLALMLSKKILGGDGAVRVHGGGFAGTIIAFVPYDRHPAYVSEMKRVFGGENVFTTDIRQQGSCRVEL